MNALSPDAQPLVGVLQAERDALLRTVASLTREKHALLARLSELEVRVRESDVIHLRQRDRIARLERLIVALDGVVPGDASDPPPPPVRRISDVPSKVHALFLEQLEKGTLAK